MAPRPGDDDGPSLLTKLVVAGIGAFVVLTVIGWVLGAILSVLRFLVLVAVAAAIVVAAVRSRSDR